MRESAPVMEIEAEVTKMRSGISGRKESVEKLTGVVEPLSERESMLRKYCDQLRNMDLEHDRAVEKKAEEKAAESSRHIQRRKVGGPPQ